MQQNWLWLRMVRQSAFMKVCAVIGGLFLLAFVLSVGQSLFNRSASTLVETPLLVETTPAPPTPPPVPVTREGMVFIPGGSVHLGATAVRWRAHAATLSFFKGRPKLIEQFVENNRDEPHEVVYVRSFWIDKYEVTNAQYARFARTTGYSAPSHWTDGQLPAGKDDHPVTHVRYADAAAYAAWAGKQLPTVAQWTRAFRGDDDRMYPWGDQWFPDRANVVENTAFPLGTSPVQSTPRDVSPFGVFNLAGNVSEILRDRTMKGGAAAMIRKGAHSETRGQIYAGASYRVLLVGEETFHDLTGFRCVLEEN